MATTQIQTVEDKLRSLRLLTMAEKLSFAINEDKAKNNGTLWILDYLLAQETETRRQRAILNRYRLSKLFEKSTIDQFNFHFHPSRQKNRSRIMNLMNLEFLNNHADVIFIGNPGTGKSFMAKTIAYQACINNISVLFTTAADMINHLVASEADHSLVRKIQFYQKPVLLVCDELGYLPLGRQGSNLFFQVISSRHGRCSTLITTNLAFSEWGKIFDSSSVAVAVADRLVENSELVVMEGPSYRRKAKSKSAEPDIT